MLASTLARSASDARRTGDRVRSCRAAMSLISQLDRWASCCRAEPGPSPGWPSSSRPERDRARRASVNFWRASTSVWMPSCTRATRGDESCSRGASSGPGPGPLGPSTGAGAGLRSVDGRASASGLGGWKGSRPSPPPRPKAAKEPTTPPSAPGPSDPSPEAGAGPEANRGPRDPSRPMPVGQKGALPSRAAALGVAGSVPLSSPENSMRSAPPPPPPPPPPLPPRSVRVGGARPPRLAPGPERSTAPSAAARVVFGTKAESPLAEEEPVAWTLTA
mmetsp:Transcript_18901/g.63330  ORF Transcript_18901/g.63330 Transcript_18901/m.63330 type:complete len:276 (+) Transcript_18901:430-1257(+)